LAPKSSWKVVVGRRPNTAYFHKIAKGRKRKNDVLSLDNNGVSVEGTDNLVKHAIEYIL
jgi:hypothetical protein